MAFCLLLEAHVPLISHLVFLSYHSYYLKGLGDRTELGCAGVEVLLANRIDELLHEFHATDHVDLPIVVVGEVHVVNWSQRDVSSGMGVYSFFHAGVGIGVRSH